MKTNGPEVEVWNTRADAAKEQVKTTRIIRLRGAKVHADNGPDEVTISMPAVTLCDADVRTLDRLFPHTGSGIDRLLALEALAQAIR